MHLVNCLLKLVFIGEANKRKASARTVYVANNCKQNRIAALYWSTGSSDGLDKIPTLVGATLQIQIQTELK